MRGTPSIGVAAPYGQKALLKDDSRTFPDLTQYSEPATSPNAEPSPRSRRRQSMSRGRGRGRGGKPSVFTPQLLGHIGYNEYLETNRKDAREADQYPVRFCFSPCARLHELRRG